MNSLVENIMHKFYEFTRGVRVQMLIDRGISNSNKGSKRWITKLISTSPVEFKKNVEKLVDLQLHLQNPDVRLYSCVNSRNMDKAINYFQHKQLNIATEEEKLIFYRNINNKFCSSLMKPENKKEKFFLIDLDSKDNAHFRAINSFLENYCIEILLIYETVKGSHFVVSPFNPVLLDQLKLTASIKNCEIKKDGLILLNYWDGNNILSR